MLNIEELKSCIEENLRQNREYETLIADLKATKCVRHGNEFMRVCPDCHGIQCMSCNMQACQCWNDD